LGFPRGAVVKNLLDSAGDFRDAGSIPGSGRSPGGGMVTHSSILAWKIPWTKEPDGLQSMGLQSWKPVRMSTSDLFNLEFRKFFLKKSTWQIF